MPRALVYWQRGADQGRAVQVKPMKPTLISTVTKRLKLEFDEPHSNFALKCNLRRYTWGMRQHNVALGGRTGMETEATQTTSRLPGSTSRPAPPGAMTKQLRC